MSLSVKQRGVLRGIVLAGGITVLALGGAIWLSRDWLVPEDDVAARLTFAFQWDMLVIFWLLITIGTLARHRFFTPEDIDGSGLTAGSATAKTHQAVLQNTLEQVVLAIPIHLSFSLLLPTSSLAAIPIAAILFSLGRILFWRGYHTGAPGRALGFALTFYPTVLLFLITAFYLVFG
ncbi:MAG: MAPEG family protein [Stappiaceae bacterium]